MTFDGFADDVAALELPQGTSSKIEAAQQQFLEGDVDEAIATLQSLINQTNALEGKRLSAEEADQIRTAGPDPDGSHVQLTWWSAPTAEHPPAGHAIFGVPTGSQWSGLELPSSSSTRSLAGPSLDLDDGGTTPVPRQGTRR